ncbi:hypothetical protein FOZ60_010067 [Perkinsus olseni]|uniref:Selenocysteine-specific elongation factor n=1 Tax=Perkinsus olseni TaxID=32597 RepID=A0A7J6NH87_PEROL|nr:hypothetical protein FOZ60_010067 [Perkinsus olseni]
MTDSGCNINIGVLGHVDCGKTSLCRALTQVASTASLDKNPQSVRRGITIDLGFSSFTVKQQQQHQRDGTTTTTNEDTDELASPSSSTTLPQSFLSEGYNSIQFCLVDCPGHASLIRTIIGGAQIIDVCMLVIDITKVRGAGTILTGTVISGMVRVGQDVVILDSATGKMASSSSTTTGGSSKNNKVIVKSIQMFKKNVKTASEGARCALCIPGINANTLERGIIMSTPPPPPAGGGGRRSV